MQPAYGLVRVSTSEQGKSGLGLAAQIEAIQAFAKAEGFELVEIITEVASGKGGVEERPDLQSVLVKAKKLKCPVIVSKLDRLSRDVAFISSLMSRGVSFIVAELGIDTDPFVLHLYAALSEKERKMIGARTKAALAKLKEQGIQLGNLESLSAHRAKGHATNSAKAKEFANKMRPMIQQYRQQGLSLAEIAEKLNMMGVKTMLDGTWSHSTISRLLSKAST